MVAALREQVGVVAVRTAGPSSHGTELTADLARECADEVLTTLRRLGVLDRGLVSLEPLDTALGGLVEQAERDTIVGAMVVGPEFGPLAGLAVG